MPDGSQFFTTAQIGPNRALTPAGFMLCRGVPIARTGVQIYSPGETPIPPGPDGITRIYREESEVFRPEFIASFNGMPFTVSYDAIESGDLLNHPAPSGVGQWTVNPQNWRDHIGGVVLNPRRGEGIENEFVVADILVCDQRAIDEIDAGSRQVSAGYNAEYQPVLDAEGNPIAGQGRQFDMVANHVALVHAARCGPRCSIGDIKTINMTGDCSMPITLKTLAADIRAAWKTKDEAKVEEVLEKAEKAEKAETSDRKMSDEDIQREFSEIKDSIKSVADSVKSVADSVKAAKDAATEESEEEKKAKAADAEAEKAEEEQVKEETGATADAAIKTADSRYLGDSFGETVAAAEILVPGIRLPTFDSAKPRKQTLDTICGLRRNALDLAYATPEGRGLVEQIHGKPLELKDMSCGAVRTLFRAAVGAKRVMNNGQQRSAAHDMRQRSDAPSLIKSPADLNAYYAKLYGGQS